MFPGFTEQVVAAGAEVGDTLGRLRWQLSGQRLRQVDIGLPSLHARRLRGRIACSLAATGARRAGDTLRQALVVLDSDLPSNPVLLTAAARRATELGDLTLAVRIARAAVSAGGGFEPRLLMGNALTWSGGVAEAETELAALGSLAHTDAERVQAAIPRVAALAWGLAPSRGSRVRARCRREHHLR